MQCSDIYFFPSIGYNTSIVFLRICKLKTIYVHRHVNCNRRKSKHIKSRSSKKGHDKLLKKYYFIVIIMYTLQFTRICVSYNTKSNELLQYNQN